MGRKAEGILFLHHVHGHAEDGAVGGDQREIDTEGLIQGRAHLLQHDLDHLHEGGDDEDEGDCLQEFQLERQEEVLVEQVGHQGRQGDDEADGGGHAGCRGELVGHTQERADTQELRQDDVVDEDRRNDDQ